jgi:MFS family permease
MPPDPPPPAATPKPDDAGALSYEPDQAAILAEPPSPEPHDPYVALRHPGYFRYFVGNAFSLLGSNMTTYAVAYELYRRTHSSLILGMVGLVQVIPILLLALPAGFFIDRFNRKKMILIATAAQIVLWIIMGFSSRYANTLVPGLGSVFHLGDAHAVIMLSLLLLNGVGRAVNQPAKQTLLPLLVPARYFHNAVTWNASQFETSNVLGPMIGGLALAQLLTVNFTNAWAFAILYWANALCGLIYWVNIARIHLPATPPPQPHAARQGMIASIIDGIRFLFEQKIILTAITLDMFAVLLGGATALLPVFADRVLQVGPVGLAGLRAAPSIGAVLMALLTAHLPPMKNAGRNLLYAVAGFGAAIIVFGLSRNYWLSLVALFATGLFDNVSVVVRHSLVQLLTPDPMRGRVNSVNTVFISSSNELGEFESGVTAYAAQRFCERFWSNSILGTPAVLGPELAVVAGGAGTIVVVIIAALAVGRELAKIKRLDQIVAK